LPTSMARKVMPRIILSFVRGHGRRCDAAVPVAFRPAL
jgi:hypothetical protein